jgi:hypothetical protein
LVVSTIGDSATTLTTSDNAAGFKTKLMTASWSITRITSGRRSVVNPCISAVSEYVPGGSAGTRYTPLGSVTTLRERPVARFFAVIVAPGMTPPDWSLRIPEIWAFCANAGTAMDRVVMAKTRERIRVRITSSSRLRRE